MSSFDWNEMYPDRFMFSLTNAERRYLALESIAEDAQTLTYVRKESFLYTRVTVFFQGDYIVKVINESLAGKDGVIWLRQYQEYDTRLLTQDRQLLLPMTARGKPKKLTASNINAIKPFGCSFHIDIRRQFETEIYLFNPRSSRRFPLGEENTIRTIRTEEDFRAFLTRYIATCGEDYFHKLRAFQNARKQNVRYRPGDIFRMEYDRTRYCYGIITGDLKQLKALVELRKEHSFLHLMTVPIMVRLYRMITEDAELTVEDLSGVPLDPVIVCSDNDIIWGMHPIVGHKELTPEDLDFKLNCILQTHYTGRFTLEGSSMYIEWGFASASLTYEQMSKKLKSQLDRFSFFYGGVSTAIAPWFVTAEDSPGRAADRCDLLGPDHSDLRAEVFACLGLPADTTFDQFAEKFGGLTSCQILSQMAQAK